MAEPKLRNCPFCGGEAKYENSLYVKPLQDENGAYVDYDEMYYWERTYCTECGAEISSESDDDEEEITIAKWNRRADNGFDMKVEIPDWKKAKYIADMSAIADYSDKDKELAHINADGLLLEILKEIGLSEVAEEFDRFEKWYS